MSLQMVPLALLAGVECSGGGAVHAASELWWGCSYEPWLWNVARSCVGDSLVFRSSDQNTLRSMFTLKRNSVAFVVPKVSST